MSDPVEKQSLQSTNGNSLAYDYPISEPNSSRFSRTYFRIMLLSFVLVLFNFCTWTLNCDYGTNESASTHCSHILPIGLEEFQARQSALASTLSALNASAYIAEPGANAGYFGNITSAHWSLSERPLLLVVSPQSSSTAKISVLTPTFEATRAKLLPIPPPSLPDSESGLGSIKFIEWPEESDPFAILTPYLSNRGSSQPPKIYVDPSIRHFIVDGLQNALGSSAVVSAAPLEIRRLREQKSKSEIEVMKCANEATLLAIRDVRSKLKIGMKESEVGAMMRSQLSQEGLKDGGCLTLFGENAALPHGSGTDRTLKASDFVLLDCGGSLHGYISDVTRTFALDSSEISQDHDQLWHYVQSTQSVALAAARKGVKTGEVDETARRWLDILGYGQYFTHRLGHGIGLQGHESPYLRGGSEDVIDNGHAFSNEPGIYIEGEVGVRLEDCFYIDETGLPVYFTEGVGGAAASPWAP